MTLILPLERHKGYTKTFLKNNWMENGFCFFNIKLKKLKAAIRTDLICWGNSFWECLILEHLCKYSVTITFAKINILFKQIKYIIEHPNSNWNSDKFS